MDTIVSSYDYTYANSHKQCQGTFWDCQTIIYMVKS